MFRNQTGIKDHLTGKYIISLPSWSRTVYYKGTKIEYSHNDNLYADEIKLDGPTTEPLRVVVSVDFAFCLTITFKKVSTIQVTT